MKHWLSISIILSFCYFTGNSQSQTAVSVDYYKTISCLKLVEVISREQLYGEIQVSHGTVGTIVTLDSNMKYKMQFYDCTSKTTADKGTWEILNNRMLQINSIKFGKRIYDIVQYDGVYYFIEPILRKPFLLSITKETSSPITENGFIIDGKKYIHVHNTAVSGTLEIFTRKSLGPDYTTSTK